jgi:CubicO group peptidase (beta-lactamase class C family)
LCCGLVFFAPAESAEAEAAISQEVIARVDAQAAAEFAKDHVGSVTVGLVSASGLAWTKSYGLADMDRKIPASAETIYRIGSITKQFTALMLLQLVQENKVQLSDPAAKYFPEVDKIPRHSPDAPAMTLVQLATHSAGLDREPGDMAIYTKGPVSDWEKVLIAALPHTKYISEPGTRYSYSNIGYAILGAALSRAIGQPYIDYVKQHIFAPLGMSHTCFATNDQMSTNLARGYQLESGKVDSETPEREHGGRGYKVPNGAIYTTVGDLARFVSFEMGEGPATVLKPEEEARIHERVVTTNGQFVSTDAILHSGYGIGFMALRNGNTIIYGHAGAVTGYEAAAYFEPRSKLGVIVLRSALGGDFNSANVVHAAFGLPVAPAKPHEIDLTPQEAEEYLGHFGEPPKDFTVTQHEGHLLVKLGKERAAALFESAKDEFFYKVVDARITFKRGPDGKINGLVLHHNGSDFLAEKDAASKP